MAQASGITNGTKSGRDTSCIVERDKFVSLAVGRSGNTFTSYSSSDGQVWVPVDGSTVTLTTGDAMLAGVAVTSHDPGYLSTVTADSVMLTQPASPLAMATAAKPTAGVAFPFIVTANEPFGKRNPSHA